VAGGREIAREQERGDHRHVKQDRRGRGGGEAVERVEDAAVERHQRDQQQIGKGDARELDRKAEALRIGAEAGRQHVDNRRREQQRHREQHHLARQQQSENAVGEKARALRPVLLADAGIGGHEGGVEGALGEDGAEMVRQPQRHEEGVGHGTRAEHGRQDDVADEPGRARQQGVAAHRQDALDHRLPLRALGRIYVDSCMAPNCISGRRITLAGPLRPRVAYSRHARACSYMVADNTAEKQLGSAQYAGCAFFQGTKVYIRIYILDNCAT